MNKLDNTGLIAINVLPALFIILLASDIYDVIMGHGGYPFNSDFNHPYSIYASSTIYLAFNTIHLLLLVVMILLSIMHKWKSYIVLLVINLIMFFYPMLML